MVATATVSFRLFPPERLPATLFSKSLKSSYKQNSNHLDDKIRCKTILNDLVHFVHDDFLQVLCGDTFYSRIEFEMFSNSEQI